MIQVIPQTRDEKIAMYLKLTKRELAEMLVGANEAVSLLSGQQQWQITIPDQTYSPPAPITTTTWSPLNNLVAHYHGGGVPYQ
ncbi:MAG: hypothetical protein V3S55_06500 [Nitrospiraceae bacterium]